MTTTSAIRRQLRSKRKQLAPSQVEFASKIVAQQLLSLRHLQRASTIALYLPIHNEIDLSSILDNSGHQYCLPRVEGKHIEMREYINQQSLVESDWGIDEPAADTQVVEYNQIDVLVMPLVGFSSCGDRIGMGGGFYDRYLDQKSAKRPICIGVAYHWQLAKFAPEPWDQPLDIVVTDRQVLSFN